MKNKTLLFLLLMLALLASCTVSKPMPNGCPGPKRKSFTA